MLSNCIFDVLKNNFIHVPLQEFYVVICFQIVSLTYWKTTRRVQSTSKNQLWFAFKLYLWRIEKQPVSDDDITNYSCDLLSNCIFDVLKNNDVLGKSLPVLVVICFQIVSLTYWKTTGGLDVKEVNKLWFAFKLYLWRIEKQRYARTAIDAWSCDLLSNCIFDVLKNNQPWLSVQYHWGCDLLSNCIFDVLKNNADFLEANGGAVVICFQIVSLTYWKTTTSIRCIFRQGLWFAFKLYLWRIEKQLCRGHSSNSRRCDLLSNCIFDVLKNNHLTRHRAETCVVICFQIVSLTYWKTTSYIQGIEGNLLWFAFKLYLWRIEKQLRVRACPSDSCCDLLSNCIFDVLKNNLSSDFKNR